MRPHTLIIGFLLCLSNMWGRAESQSTPSLTEQNDMLLQQMQRVHHLSAEQMTALRSIFAVSGFMGQGNPAITFHPATPQECQERLNRRGVQYENPTFSKICGDSYMAPLYNPGLERPEDARVCIDQFEFPNIPCAYPVVWVRASEAAQICDALGKRLCDAHEWEGACAGNLEDPDYRFDLAAHTPPESAIKRMRETHNRSQSARKSWSYGTEYIKGICAASSSKSPTCEGGGWATCGSNTYPAGFYPECRSSLYAYDLHGNVAEHMNLPLTESQMASRGSREYGYTEMKGSWFIFDRYRAHEDWCRWRAPYWHGTRVLDPKSHYNYHLGFRCCKSLNHIKGK